MLDPAEPLTEIKTMSIEDWTQKQWPTLEVQYDTHLVGRDTFTTVEWHGVLDASSGDFVNRLPFGITRRVRGGPEESHSFQIGRISPTTLLIADHIAGTKHPYQCSDPCVVDARTLLSAWLREEEFGKLVGVPRFICRRSRSERRTAPCLSRRPARSRRRRRILGWHPGEWSHSRRSGPCRYCWRS
jgi:hypothetical protein